MRKTMTMRAAGQEYFFENDPSRWLERSLGLVLRRTPPIGWCVLLVVAMGWVPLAILSLLQSAVSGSEALNSFASEVGAHARYLIAAPLLIAGESMLPDLGRTVRQFLRAGLVTEEKRGSFEAAVLKTRALLNHPVADIVIVSLAYAAVGSMAAAHGYAELPAWHRLDGSGQGYSPAGWWHVLVSLPLLLILLLRWVLRLALWTRLLWLISRLDLRLVGSHPDHAAGLAFVGHSVRLFSLVGVAVATIVAGRTAHLVMVTGTVPLQQIYFNCGVLIAVMVVLMAPVLVFTPSLVRVWRHATHAYGALAGAVGGVFEQKWLSTPAKIDPSALEAEDFSATTDLYSVVANVYGLRFIPLGLEDAAILAGAMLLPFVPVVLLAVPLNVILSMVQSLLF